ncbi:hypothetical protein D7B24_002307 [Verticillium nonalfalfae]|uniref:Glucanase n=1 Tax=Verticillium nonalfalfae TaxID=1051616 RepID=A0A3M9XYT5_9PEZI|nr:uncharacterized protein D7B24_002307 [Verticillium nonalfalfae]RNJ53154.1 hypothetical protein D7B24_002307 [Verticillium nonalfalfae]
MKTAILSGLSLLAVAMAQQVGTEEPEVHPKITWKRCTGTNGSNCATVNGEIVIDANWRWAHNVGGYQNCFDGNDWTGLCTGAEDCAKNCAVEGANYGATYGVSTSGDALTLKFVTQHNFGTNIGSRTYLMENESKYQMFTLNNNELAFDVDLSTIPCGMNSALYLVPMKSDGGLSDEPNNKAGAKYGTGYCDAQCARDLKFINGKGNIVGWEPSPTDDNAGVGAMGSCCAEIDIWESNRESFAFTPHACKNNSYHVCTDTTCGGTYSEDRYGGGCDANGCDYNPYRLGNTEFYGTGKTVDTRSKFTVISRFRDNVSEQVFIQNGNVIVPPKPTLAGLTQFNAAITPEFCTAYPTIFGDRNRHDEIGGHTQLNAAYRLPMVLVLSVWADHFANMLWLDSIYPPERRGEPGVARGRCPETGRTPADVIRNHPNASVTWSNIRFGPIGSTHNTSGAVSPPVTPPSSTTRPVTPPTTTTRAATTTTRVAPPTTTTASTGGPTAPKWGQCGGQGWTGPTVCAAGSTCQAQNQWYSQCL